MNTLTKLALPLLLLAGSVFAGDHPTPLAPDTTPAQCLSCHKDKGSGKSVHSAIAMGCTVCHQVNRRGDSSTVTLTAPPEQICFNCHTRTEAKVVHKPYANGQCIVCHDPHATDHKRQLRAELNKLCLECHMERSDIGARIRVLGRHEYTPAEWQSIPKIQLDVELQKGHPTARHPVSGARANGNPGEGISCLSCHLPHASPSPKLLPARKRSGVTLCSECHTRKPGLPGNQGNHPPTPGL